MYESTDYGDVTVSHGGLGIVKREIPNWGIICLSLMYGCKLENEVGEDTVKLKWN